MEGDSAAEIIELNPVAKTKTRVAVREILRIPLSLILIDCPRFAVCVVQ